MLTFIVQLKVNNIAEGNKIINKLKIAYIGNFTQSHCTEVHIASTLESMGHQVTRMQENQLSRNWANTLTENNTDLLLYTRTWGTFVTLQDLEILKQKNIITASYHLDLYVGIKREDGLDNDPFWRTDYVFTPDGDRRSADVFKQKNINHIYIKPGVFKDECYIGEFIPKYSSDVAFVGGGVGYAHKEWPYRGQLVTWLSNTYRDRYKKYGHPEETVRNKDLNNLYASTKVVVGDTLCTNFDHEYYWSDRVYETIGRGGFIIHPFIKGMDEEFQDRKNIVFYEYKNFDQLKSLIDYYVTNENERKEIQQAGHELVKNNYTYHERLKEALGHIDFNKKEKIEVMTNDGIEINLGCGSEPTPGFVNVDWIDQEGVDKVHNLLHFPYPFKDNSAKFIKAIDVLEHMPSFTEDHRSFSISFIEECHRILKPGGELFIQVPHWQSKNLWIDPTHVRGYDEQSFDYFDPDKFLGQAYGYYSDKKFRVSSLRTSNDNIEFTMVKL